MEDRTAEHRTEGDGAHQRSEIDGARASETERRWQPAFLSGFLILVLVGLCVVLWLRDESGSEAGPLPVLAVVPEFRMKDQSAADFESTSLRGKVWVASFIFTACGSACPHMTRQMRVLQEELSERPALFEKVRLVSFSVDPGRDRPEVLREFAREYDADVAQWHFLTGSAAETVRLSQQGFLLAAAAGMPGSVPTHSDRFALVDTRGRLRGHYQPLGESRDLSRLIEDIESLLAEEGLPAAAEVEVLEAPP